jgi:hypothetical protein
MNHLTEDQFVLLYYGDTDQYEITGLEDHVAVCSECRNEFERVRTWLGGIVAHVPEPADDYPSDVWNRLVPLLPEKTVRRRTWFEQPKWAIAMAMAAAVFASFMIGRWFERNTEITRSNPTRQTVAADSPDTAAARERVLLAAVGDHLERAQIVLVEVANTNLAPAVDISTQQDTARGLLADNRIYRQTAIQLRDAQIAALLDELERLLMDLSHLPSMPSASEFGDIRDQIETQGLLFKVRIAGSELRSRQQNTMGRPSLPGTGGL